MFRHWGVNSEFERLFKENYSRLFQYAYNYLNDKGASEDIVSDAFEYLWVNYKCLENENRLSVLFQQVKHRSIDYLRHNEVVKKYVVGELQAGIEQDEVEERDDERLKHVLRVIDTLSPQTRCVLEECYFHQKKYLEVAEKLGISTNTVKKHIIKALRLLRTELKK